ncbi:UNVERIFIED_CONTAM: hypothetical protein Scaly_1618700 [Sesamum calycinum]|uniref:DUF4218 domain-containing protein n=1 Tax=Sesamum calycinum TaxID=2727403 RepID=A0AAW2PAT1_9LAMI
MDHLIVHLPYEARIGGPVQYRWMYSFERFLRELKKKVKNKAHVEASIVKEIGLFTLQYFESDVQSKRSMPRRNDEHMSSDDRIQHQTAHTSRRQAHENDDENEDEDEDSDEDNETDDDEYEVK